MDISERQGKAKYDDNQLRGEKINFKGLEQVHCPCQGDQGDQRCYAALQCGLRSGIPVVAIAGNGLADRQDPGSCKAK